jgi:hypothetical protein
MSNDALFSAELKRGHAYAVEVAHRLLAMGIAVEVTPLSMRKTINDRARYLDMPNIVVPGNPEWAIGVKSRNLCFTGAHDFPYETAFVDTTSGWDQKKRKPIAVVLISQQTHELAVVPGSTYSTWQKVRAHDMVRNLDDTFYSVPRMQLVEFDKLVNFLRAHGRIVR